MVIRIAARDKKLNIDHSLSLYYIKYKLVKQRVPKKINLGYSKRVRIKMGKSKV